MSIREHLLLADPAAVVERITTFLIDQVRGQNRDGAILGLSGGVDSALDAFLAVKALGPSRVSLLFLPERDSSPQSRADAVRVATILGVPLQIVSITPLLRAVGAYRLEPPARFIPRTFQERYVVQRYRALQEGQPSTFLRTLRGGDGVEELRRSNAYLHIKHRLRMVMWYYWGELRNQMIVGNCNLTEKMTGYFIRYGDSGSDVDLIAGLYKTQVWQLASFVGVPEEIVRKAPSPDIAPGMTDEFALQMRYEVLDQILWGLAHAVDPVVIEDETGATAQQLAYVQELVRLSAPMRTLPPSPDLTDLVS
ncbi:MAG: NAD(+) synthase [Synergistaceae bacterium]|nr:NAD(+) synthase [Synergistaceae bacterium]